MATKVVSTINQLLYTDFTSALQRFYGKCITKEVINPCPTLSFMPLSILLVAILSPSELPWNRGKCRTHCAPQLHTCIPQKQVQEKTRRKITGTRKFDGLSNCCPRSLGRALTLRYFNASLDFSAVCLRARYQSLLSFKCNWWKEEITTQRRTHKTEKEKQFQVLCTDFVETKTTQSTDSEFSAAVMRPKILITPKRVNQSIHQPESMFVVRYYIVLNSVVKIKAVYKGEKET